MALVARQQDQRALAGGRAQALDVALLVLDTGVDAREDAVEDHLQRFDGSPVGRRLQLFEHLVGATHQGVPVVAIVD